VLLCAASNALALDPNKLLTQYMRDAWTTASGLPQNAAFSIVQTRDGYLWFGTLEGLVRFDGLEFTVYDSANTPEMPNANITALYEDHEGALWIAPGGLYSPPAKGNTLLCYKDGKFQPYTEQDGYPGDPAMAICGAREGGLWIATSKGLCRFKDGRFHSYTTKDGLSGDSILSLYEDREGTIWIGTNHGLNQYKDGRFIAFDPHSPLSQQAVKAIHEGKDGSHWIGTPSGLSRLKDGQLTNYTTKDGLPENEVMAINEDRDGNLWLGTAHGHLTRWRDGKFSESLNLADDPVWSIYEDKEGSLWVGTYTGGLHRLRDGKFTTYTTVEGLLSDSTWGVFEDNEGNVWISTSKGLNQIRDGQMKSYTRKDGLLETGVSKVYQDSQGSLWVGTTAGLNQFKDGKFIGFRFPGGENSFVAALHEDAKGNLWVGTTKGLFRYDHGEFKKYVFKYDMPGSLVNSIYEDKDGALWLGTSAGLFRFKDEKFTHYPVPDVSPVDLIATILPDDDGALWLGTGSNGLLRFKDGQFTRYTAREGLFNNSVFIIFDDGRGDLWMGCSKGVFRVSKRELLDFADGKIRSINSASYGTADGMKSRELTAFDAGWKTRDGRLWFPTVKGVAVIDPSRLKLNTNLPPVYIKQALADGQAANLNEQIEIKPGTRNVEFHYAGLSLLAPESVKYKYHLEGFDKDWLDAGARRVAYYTNLPPGEYEFRVIAANNDDMWNMEGASIRLTVRAPFWKRWWFLLAAGGAVAAVALFIFRARISQLRKKQAAQEAFSRKLIASQEQERKRLAVELHDGLGQSLVIIKNRALMSLNKPEDHERARTQIEEISEAASAALQEIREIAASLHPYQLDRFGLVSALEEMIARLAASSPVQFSHEIAPIDGQLSKEAQINLYRIVQESLNNIVKHAQASAAKITLKQEAGVLRLLIEDNGKGFDAAALAERTRGLGLTGIAERARVLGGRSEIHSVPGQGTTIRLEMQLKEPADER
jgi:ligand-binding sensor domain-containing protein/signal transduction histidine kinase